MFAFRNFTGVSFVGKIGKFGIEFTAGIIEEVVTLNITGSAAVHAVEIPENIINAKLISKDPFITSTSMLITSNTVQTKLFDVIASATPNLFL